MLLAALDQTVVGTAMTTELATDLAEVGELAARPVRERRGVPAA